MGGIEPVRTQLGRSIAELPTYPIGKYRDSLLPCREDAGIVRETFIWEARFAGPGTEFFNNKDAIFHSYEHRNRNCTSRQETYA
jgi:hypothetical protein